MQKTNRLKWSLIAIFLSLVSIISLGLFSSREMISYAAEETPAVQNSYYLYDGSNGYKSEIVAGTTSGYDRYELGVPATLTAMANDGFEIKGWIINVGYENTFYTDGEYTIGGSKVTISIAGNKSTMAIEKAFDNLMIEPVFDYKYYNLEIEHFDKLKAIGTKFDLVNSKIDENGADYLYYSATEGSTYKDVVIKSNGKYYYYGIVVKVGEYFYTQHDDHKADTASNTKDMNVPVSRGAFRLGQEITYDFNINVNGIFDSDTFIQVIGFTFNGEPVAAENVTINDDARGFTTSGNVKLEIPDNNNNLLVMDYNQLYRVTIAPSIITRYYFPTGFRANSLKHIYKIGETYYAVNGSGELKTLAELEIETPTSEELNSSFEIVGDNINDPTNLIDGTTIIDHIYNKNNIEIVNGTKYSTHQYLISDKNVTINCSDVQSQEKYTYYNYIAQNLTKQIDEDIDVAVYFAPMIHKVEFKFMQYDGQTFSSLDGDYNVLATRYVKRGTTITLDQKAPNNLGFEFVNYFLESATDNYTQIDEVVVVASEPQDITVTMAYDYIRYGLNITENNLSLTNTKGEKIGAFSSGSLYINGESRDVRPVDNVDGYKVFNDSVSSVKIGDTIKFEITGINTGFILESILLNNSTDPKDCSQEGITIDEAIINDYINNGNFNIYITSKHKLYTFTYESEYGITSDGTDTKYLMANIGVDNVPSDAEIKKYDLEGAETTDDSLVAKIVIEGLKLYSQFNLTSSGINQNIFQLYNWCGFEYIKNDIKHTLPIIIDKEDANILQAKVIYASPKSTLQLFPSRDEENSSKPQWKDEDIIVKCGDVELSRDTEKIGYNYNIQFEDNATAVNMEIRIDLSNTSFGFKYKEYTLTKKDIGGENPSVSSSVVIDENGILIVSYTAEPVIDYQLICYYDLIEYAFNVSYENESGEQVKEFKFTIDTPTDDLKIEFDKPTGYFVKEMYIIDEEDQEIIIDEMAETNDNPTEIYEFDFEKVINLEDFIKGNSDYFLEESGGILKTIKLKAVYEIYKYSIAISFSIKDDVHNGADKIDFVDPIVIVNGNPLEYYEEENALIYQDIEHGSNVEIEFKDMKHLGLRYNEFFGGDNLSANTTLEGINKNYNIEVEMSYIAYVLKAIYNSKEGEYLFANSVGNKIETISRFDSIKIQSKPNTDIGFLFKAIYVEYKYDQQDFAINYADYYIYEYDETNKMSTYTPNESNEYDANKVYLRVLGPITKGEYAEQSFDIEQYVASGSSGNAINVYFEYGVEYLQISETFLFVSYNFLINDGENGKDYNINIADSDVANIEYVATRGLNESRILNENDKVDYYDTVTAYVRINKEALETVSQKVYDLTNFVTVKDYKINKTIVKGDPTAGKEIGEYIITFDVSDVIGTLKDLIELIITFEIQECDLEVTTNISGEYKENIDYFYSQTNLSIDFGNYGGGPKENSSGKASATTTRTFLYSAGFDYEWNKEFDDEFKISSVNIYTKKSKDGDYALLDSASDLYTRMVKITKIEGSENIDYVSLYRIDSNVKVEFVVQPIINIKTENDGYIEIMDGTYNINKTFKCDNLGQGVQQPIEIPGDLEAGEIVKTAMQIKYLQNGIDVGIPVNAGDYQIEITFNVTGQHGWLKQYTWIKNLKLIAKINVLMAQKEIELGYKENMPKSQQEYNASSAYDKAKNEVLANLVYKFTDQDGEMVSLDYGNKNLELIVNNIAMEMVAPNEAGVLVPVKDVGGYYDVKLSNLFLSETNGNFILKNNSLILPQLVEVYKRKLTLDGLSNPNLIADKVEDDTNVAHFLDSSVLKLSGVCSTSDDVGLDRTKIVLKFTTKTKGDRKEVELDPTLALTGNDAKNYEIEKKVFTSFAGIYPYSISTTIEGVGSITLRNDLALTDSTAAKLIPIDAKLTAVMIDKNEEEFRSFSNLIAGYLSRMNVYSLGYSIKLTDLGVEKNIDNRLTLILPTTENMDKLLWVTADKAGELQFDKDGDIVALNLSNVEGGIKYIVAVEEREFITWWQILLIVLSVIVVIGSVVAVFIVVRNKKKRAYSVHDKI